MSGQVLALSYDALAKSRHTRESWYDERRRPSFLVRPSKFNMAEADPSLSLEWHANGMQEHVYCNRQGITSINT
jgi:hypothetical protein